MQWEFDITEVSKCWFGGWSCPLYVIWICVPGSSVHGILQARILEWVASGNALLQEIFLTQGSNLSLLHCRHILLPYETPGKPKNIRAGSHSFLQGIFPTHGLNLGFLRYRQTLYHLSTREAQSESVSHCHVQLFVTPWTLAHHFLCPLNSLGKYIGVHSSTTDLINSVSYVVIVQLLSRVWLFENPWTSACQTSLSFTISWSLRRLMLLH